MAARRRESAIMGPTVDADGRCPRHPFLRLRMRSHLTGEWATLLDSCPVCLMEGGGRPASTTLGEESDCSFGSDPPRNLQFLS